MPKNSIMTPEERTYEIETGKRLRAAMAYRGMSALKLEEISGLTRQTIWRYQTGRVRKSLVHFWQLASALDVSLDWLADLTLNKNQLPWEKNGGQK
jgi:transcriptional regulator with XRE-family HTH domain